VTHIKKGTARRQGLRKPDLVLEFEVRGPDVFGAGGDPLWFDIQRQLREGNGQPVLDMQKLAEHVAGQTEAFQIQARRFMEAFNGYGKVP
jgi:hypothetical protein